MKRTVDIKILLRFSSVAFVLLSAMAGAGWLYATDTFVMSAAQTYASSLLDSISGLFSALGSWEITGAFWLVLVAVLFRSRRERLAGRLLFAFLATGLLEYLLKMYLPVPPIPQEAARLADFAPFTVLELPYPYPSGHVLRSTILLGTIYFLSANWFLRAGSAIVLLGMIASRVYLGVHWSSDVLGGALLGLAAVSWAFMKEGSEWR